MRVKQCEKYFVYHLLQTCMQSVPAYQVHSRITLPSGVLLCELCFYLAEQVMHTAKTEPSLILLVLIIAQSNLFTTRMLGRIGLLAACTHLRLSMAIPRASDGRSIMVALPACAQSICTKGPMVV
jgi:hypothetical protein